MSNLFTLNFITVYANDNDAYIPELWANESLAILEETLVMNSLVHRDFQEQVANFGDVVNTRKPSTFTAGRKTDDDTITDQDATATNVPVPLNQHVYVSFIIKDGEQSKSFKDLVAEYLYPALFAQAKFIDQITYGQAGRFYPNAVGACGKMTSTTVNQYLIEARTKLNVLKAPDESRRMIWSPTSEGIALQNELFVSAEKVGNTQALREAELGRKYGFDNYHTQIAGEITTANVDVVTGAINAAAGYVAGTTALTVDGLSAAIGNNTWLTVNGDLHRVVGTTGGATPTAITIDSPGLRYAVADNDVIKIADPGAVNLAAGYAAGYAGTIAFDGMTNIPTPGQLVSFGTDPTATVYTIIQVTATTVLLDRPLAVALADNAVMNVAPMGNYNFAFQRNAIALVVRPLALPPAGTGARSAVVNFNGLSIRVVMAYDRTKQGLGVTIDMLCGVAVLDSALGTLVLG